MTDTPDITLKIRVLDAQGNFRGGTVDVEFKHRTLSDRTTQRGLDASREISIAGLRRMPQGDYQVTVTPTDVFKPQSQFVNIPASGFAELKVTIDHPRTGDPKPPEVPDVKPPVNRQRVIEGRIVMENGLPARKLALRLYSYGFGGVRKLLKETSSNDEGFYSFTYQIGGKGISLEIKAVDGAGKETPLSKLMHDLSAKEKAVVNLVAPEKLQPLAAEYRRLADDLKPHVGEMKELSKVREDAERQDLTVLNRATGWDARLIALAANAAELSADSKVGISQEILYGLFRLGLPSDKSQLASVSAEVIDHALAKLTDGGIVNLSSAERAEARKKFETFAREKRLAMAAPGSHSTYGDILKSADLSEVGSTKFAAIALDHRGSAEELWLRAAAAGISPREIRILQQQGKLAFLTVNNPPIIQRLQKNLAINDPVQLVNHDFYRADKWLAEIRAVAGNDEQRLVALIPPVYTGEKTEDRLRAYADDMARKVRLSYPTQVIGRMVEQDTADAFKLGATRMTTATLLNKAGEKGFKLGQTTVDKFVRDNPDVVSDIAPENRDVTLQSARMLQMVYQITPSNESMVTLMRLGLTSAYDVVAASHDDFIDHHAAMFPSREEAELVYRKARQVTSVTYNVFAIAQTLQSQPPMYGLSAPADEEAVRSELSKQFPTLESLFGSMDFCECEHCRSVLSPAAYLVDLLQFIDREPAVWADFMAVWRSRHNGEEYTAKYLKPYDALFRRRPDIPHISLTCENTHTALPYIDIVNEILEYYVANDGLEEEAARNTDEATTAELLAEPQNVIAEAYTTLQRAQYPLNLPFDLWIETARAFSEYFETPLWQMLETLRPSDELFAPAQPYDRASVFIESLGLSAAEYAILTDPDPLTGWHELYGYDTVVQATSVAIDAASNQRIDLNSAKTLSRRLGVSYKEIAQIVRTGFINPKLAEMEILQKLGVTVQDVFFYRDHRELLTQDPESLSSEDYIRFQEVEAFERRLNEMTFTFQGFGFDARTWLNTTLEENSFDNILILADPDAGCNFDLTTLRYADGRAVDPIAFLKINLFVRLWRKLGWSIEETDAALQAFVPRNTPYETANLNRRPLATALIYFAHLKRLDELVSVGKQSRLKLLTLWSPLTTNGNKSLYAQLFLTRNVLKSDIAFDDPLGNYLSATGLAALAQSRKHQASRTNVAITDQINAAAFAAHPEVTLLYDPLLNIQHLAYQGVLTDTDKATLAALSTSLALPPLLDEVQAKAREFSLLKGHLLALQGALGLTADEISRIVADAGGDLTTAALSFDNVSLLYRYGLLAKALKASVAELIGLKQLSGLDPFMALGTDPLTALADDHPFTQTLRFVEIAAQVKDSGLTIEDLEYLLRHRSDETGKYRPDTDSTLQLMKFLAEGIRAIRNEHAVPDDPGAMSEETLRQKLGLVLPSRVGQDFLAMMNGTIEFTATRTGVPATDRLQPAAFADESSVRELSYNATRQEQKLVFRGVLFDSRKSDLMGRLPKPAPPNPHVPSSVFGDLLNDVQAQARTFFETHLQKQPPTFQPATGFLETADFDLLFAAEPTGSSDTDSQARLRQQRTKLAQTFLPFLQERLIRQFIIQTISARTTADPALVESLLTDNRLLGDSVPLGPRQSLLTAFTAVGERGLTASFFASVDGSGPALASLTFTDSDTAAKDPQGNFLKPAGTTTNSARFAGYMEVATPGAYRFRVKLGKRNAEAELRFEHLNHLPEPFLTGTAADDDAEIGDAPDNYVELKPGRLYKFSLELKNLNAGDARLSVQGEALPKGPLTQLTLYPEAVVGRADHALSLLQKVLQLVQSLNLREREVRYLLTHAADFGNLELSALPTRAGDSTSAGSQALFSQFLRLAGYARLKRDLAGGTDDLIRIFETTDEEQVYSLIAKLMRRQDATVKATARVLFATPRFKNELTMQRLWDALGLIERFGVPAAAIANWTRIAGMAITHDQRFEIARDLKGAIKARFDAETWQRVAQPIFDKLRRRQRDALVAHVMHQRGFARIEQLYEYFLIDPGMEPVVQTSRIRLAISSVQLFIQRCLLNLESEVHPSAINSRQWEWMKRYRVWEANRKIFLFPENFLEPEFRDDKTHLFSELEGALLQGDVSNDLAEDAFLKYLQKLDDMASLDILGMHLEDNSDPSLRTLHVIGSTFGEPRQYFYRRYAHQMWTPWEPISAKVEGRHLAPVVWRDRLYLFWVTFMQKARPMGTVTVDPSEPIITSPPVIELEAQLHWSEYLKGEWHTGESGELDPPDSQKLKAISVDPRTVFIHVTKEPYVHGEERGVFINLGSPFNQSFYMAGRNSVPERGEFFSAPANPYGTFNVDATRYLSGDQLGVTFVQRATIGPGLPEISREAQAILREGGTYSLLPCDNNITLASEEAAILVKPLFYQDNSHTLFIEPTVTERTIEEWRSWVDPPFTDWRLPEIILIPEIPRFVFPVGPGDPIGTLVFVGSILPPRGGGDWLVNSFTGLMFKGELIGQGGRAGLKILPSDGIDQGIAAGSELVSLHTGNAPMTAVITEGDGAFAGNSLTLAAGALNVVGSSGLNSGLLLNLNRLSNGGGIS